MGKIISYLYGLVAVSELQASYNRIHARRLALKEYRHQWQERPRLSDRENLEQDLLRIGGDFSKAIGVVTNGQ